MIARPDSPGGYQQGASTFARRMLDRFPDMKTMAAARYAQPPAAPGPVDPSAPVEPKLPDSPRDLSGLSNTDVVALYDKLVERGSIKLDVGAAAQLQEQINGLR